MNFIKYLPELQDAIKELIRVWCISRTIDTVIRSHISTGGHQIISCHIVRVTEGEYAGLWWVSHLLNAAHLSFVHDLMFKKVMYK